MSSGGFQRNPKKQSQGLSLRFLTPLGLDKTNVLCINRSKVTPLSYISHHGVDLAVRFDLGLPSLQRVRHGLRQADGVATVECDLLSLPLYLVGQLRRFVDAYRADGG